jgi:hypothetical protein
MLVGGVLACLIAGCKIVEFQVALLACLLALPNKLLTRTKANWNWNWKLEGGETGSGREGKDGMGGVRVRGKTADVRVRRGVVSSVCRRRGRCPKREGEREMFGAAQARPMSLYVIYFSSEEKQLCM